jgi:hypothetical protein
MGFARDGEIVLEIAEDLRITPCSGRRTLAEHNSLGSGYSSSFKRVIHRDPSLWALSDFP